VCYESFQKQSSRLHPTHAFLDLSISFEIHQHKTMSDNQSFNVTYDETKEVDNGNALEASTLGMNVCNVCNVSTCSHTAHVATRTTATAATDYSTSSVSSSYLFTQVDTMHGESFDDLFSFSGSMGSTSLSGLQVHTQGSIIHDNEGVTSMTWNKQRLIPSNHWLGWTQHDVVPNFICPYTKLVLPIPSKCPTLPCDAVSGPKMPSNGLMHGCMSNPYASLSRSSSCSSISTTIEARLFGNIGSNSKYEDSSGKNDDDNNPIDHEAMEGKHGGYTKSDILLGRGGGTNKHPGNQALRWLATEFRHDYLSTTSKKEKKLISKQVVDILIGEGRRFLKKISKHEMWIPVDDDIARTKVCQVLCQ
jgi:hypothetical protein